MNKPYKKKRKRKLPELISALVSDSKGNIFDLEGYAAVGRIGSVLRPLKKKSTIPMPKGSELMFLPDRIPALYNIETRSLEFVEKNPYQPDESIFPVAVFNSPGYMLSHVSAFEEKESASSLPLFSYGAVGWHGESFFFRCNTS